MFVLFNSHLLYIWISIHAFNSIKLCLLACVVIQHVDLHLIIYFWNSLNAHVMIPTFTFSMLHKNSPSPPGGRSRASWSNHLEKRSENLGTQNLLNPSESDVTQKRRKGQRARCWGATLQGAGQRLKWGWVSRRVIYGSGSACRGTGATCEPLVSTRELCLTCSPVVALFFITSLANREAAQWEVLLHTAPQY